MTEFFFQKTFFIVLDQKENCAKTDSYVTQHRVERYFLYDCLDVFAFSALVDL